MIVDFHILPHIQSTGNAVSFGGLTTARRGIASCSSSTRGVFAGGKSPSPAPGTALNVIEYVTIMSAGNAIDFGDLLATTQRLYGCSNGHGGLG